MKTQLLILLSFVVMAATYVNAANEPPGEELAKAWSAAYLAMEDREQGVRVIIVRDEAVIELSDVTEVRNDGFHLMISVRANGGETHETAVLATDVLLISTKSTTE